jgi:hypothetical protein
MVGMVNAALVGMNQDRNQDRKMSHEPQDEGSRKLRGALARTDRSLQQFTRTRPFAATFLALGTGFLIGRWLSRSSRW